MGSIVPLSFHRYFLIFATRLLLKETKTANKPHENYLRWPLNIPRNIFGFFKTKFVFVTCFLCFTIVENVSGNLFFHQSSLVLPELDAEAC